MKISWIGMAALVLVITGCAHQVTFEKPERYTIATPRQNVSVTAVIPQETLTNKVPISAFMTGIAQTWEVEPGDMLKQVTDIELPQMFAQYEFSNTYKEAPPQGIVLELAIPSYQFEDFRAKVKVEATAYEGARKQLLKKTYSAEGESQGAKMFWGGAFGMKSAIRQSSLDAYKKIFAALRADLVNVLQSRTPVKSAQATTDNGRLGPSPG